MTGGTVCEKPIASLGLGVRGANLSIMLPNYNGAVTFADTLHSLLAQGDTIADAQIEIVDNGSTDASEAIARDILGSRLRWHRNPTNLGLCGNFNECVKRAERPWIHILHTDDVVLAGGYAEFDRCLQQFPLAQAVFGRSVVFDENNTWYYLTQEYGAFVRETLPYDPAMWAVCETLFPSTLVSRAAYDAVGGFDASLTHVLDWNMWWRIAYALPVVYTNTCVGGYRQFRRQISGAQSAIHQRTAKNLEEYVEQVNRLAASMHADPRYANVPTDPLYIGVFEKALGQLHATMNDEAAYHACWAQMRRLPARVRRSPHSRLRLLKLALKRASLKRAR